MNKRIFAVIADGFEEMELIVVADIAKRLKIEVVLAALGDKLQVTGSHQIKIECDKLLKDIDYQEFDGIFLPGGLPGSMHLYKSEKAGEILKLMNQDKKMVSAICAAPMVLAKNGLLSGHKFTMYPGMDEYCHGEVYSDDLVVVSQNILTGKGPGAAVELAMAIGDYFGLKEQVLSLRQGMFIK
jgi:4-methyl-5(b-hydroxyethyl)-thiazole monophosphate biosynthesis